MIQKFVFTSFIFLTLTNAEASFQSDYAYLDKLALEAQTDKASNGNNYTEAYAEYFAPLRDKPIKLLEVGVGSSGSAWLWDRYFPDLDLYFIDNDPGVLNQARPARAKYHIVDQSEVEELQSFISKVGGNFDIIIDDGGHFMDQQIITFETLFPYLKSGGLYVIEDLHTSYWSWFGGHGNQMVPKAGADTAVEYFKNLVEDLNYTSGLTGYGDWKKASKAVWAGLNEYQKHIHSIHFFKSLCIIKKI